jgi:DNA-binding XRE family transcriptional regulator/molybdate-binding protein
MARLQSLREERGLTQAELAAAAGISRQMVGAIEAGRHLPRVDAAIALAAALGIAVEELFPRAADAVEGVLGEPPREGEAVLSARVGERLVFVPAALGAVGCDPALGLAASLLPAAGPRRLLGVSASGAAAREAVAAGRAHVALVHGPAGELEGTAPPGSLRVELARWRVGLALAGEAPASLDDLLARGLPVAQREPGAASQEALLRELARRGAPQPPGPLARDHLEAAWLAARAVAAGVTMEPAALAHGLRFLPLEEHVAELHVGREWLAEAGVQSFLELVGSAAFRERAALVAGYDVSEAGAVRA